MTSGKPGSRSLRLTATGLLAMVGQRLVLGSKCPPLLACRRGSRRRPRPGQLRPDGCPMVAANERPDPRAMASPTNCCWYVANASAESSSTEPFVPASPQHFTGEWDFADDRARGRHMNHGVGLVGNHGSRRIARRRPPAATGRNNQCVRRILRRGGQWCLNVVVEVEACRRYPCGRSGSLLPARCDRG